MSERTSTGSEFDLGRVTSSEYLSASSALSLHDEVELQLQAPSQAASPYPRSSSLSPTDDEETIAADAASAADMVDRLQADPGADAHDDAAAHDEAEHWRNTRAATKVSLAKLPRGGLGELQRIRKESFVSGKQVNGRA